MDAARRGFFGCRWSGQHFNLLDWNLINQAKHVIMSKQAAQRKGKMNAFPDLHCRQSSKSVTGARRWRRATRGGGFVERLRWLSLQASSGPTNKSSTSLLVNMVFVSFSSYWCVQQTLLFCVKGDLGKKHVVLKAIRKPSSFADANVMFFFFFWEHLFPQAPPEPEEDGLDDEQREVDMEKEWTCGYWRYRSVDLRFLCRALDSELSSEKVPPSFSLHFQEITVNVGGVYTLQRLRRLRQYWGLSDGHQPHMIQHWKESNGIPIGVLFQLDL